MAEDRSVVIVNREIKLELVAVREIAVGLSELRQNADGLWR
jgi:hypothetical protein